MLLAAKLQKITPAYFVVSDDRSTTNTIELCHPDGELEQVQFYSDNKPTEPFNTLLVCTKSYSVLDALDKHSHRINADTTIVLIQNGMGYHEDVLTAYPSATLVVASLTEGANTAQGRLNHAARGSITLGSLTANNPTKNTVINDLKQLLNNAGFNTLVSEQIKEILWRKLIINCGINPYTAILDCPNGQILNKPLFLDTVRPLTEELAVSAKSAGIEISPKACREAIESVAKSTSQNISSMLQDIRNKRKTEIDYMNGYILKLENPSEFTCPINRKLVSLVKELEQKRS